jgi:tRNA threonylcarbamoyladenosine biosynthesis protein TsaB
VRGAPAGPVLALDSSTRAAWVAVGEGERVLAAEEVAARANASAALLPAVDRAVAAAGLVPGDLAAVVVAGGPGSFTGLRIAAATAKGVARALGAPLFAYSGLLALAAAHRDETLPVCALFDARNREVYAGCWRFGSGVEALLGVQALPVEALVERLRGRELRFAGEGSLLHRTLLEAVFGANAVLEAGRSPAEGLLRLTAAVPEAGRVADPAAWEPEYVRGAGAERVAAKGAE